MDMLRRSLSPITDAAWKEIDEQAVKVLEARLSARKFVDVSGPHGWDYAVVPTGRLDVSKKTGPQDVRWGVHVVQPLVETRIPFEMDLWELDNIVRGAKDLDLDPVVEAAHKAALFEEEAVYHGFDPACITGLSQAGASQALALSTSSPAGIMEAVTGAVVALREQSIEGPYALVAGRELWQAIETRGEGYPLGKRVGSILDGGTVFAPHIDGGFVVSVRGGDMELVLGQDISIGFEGVKGEKARLFMAESFTFRVIEPAAIVPLVKK